MKAEGTRARRVAESMRAALSRTLQQTISDPRLGDVTITGVELSDDLSIAWIRIRRLLHDDERSRRSALQALTGAAGRLRSAVAPALRLKRVPELRFAYDEGVDAARRVEELLREVDEERGT
jgi:ribosome-binding factor A